MMSLMSNDYAHCNTPMLLGGAEAAANLLSYLKTAAGEALGGLLAGEVRERVWGAVKGKVDAHLMTDYRKLLG